MKIIQFAVMALLLALPAGELLHATSTSPSLLISQTVSLKPGDQITGSLAVIQAFSAIRDNSAIALLNAITATPSSINETFSIITNQKEVKLRLIHAAILAKSPIALGLLISAGARIASKDSFGKTAAHYASFGGPDFGEIFNFKPFIDGEIASSMLELLQAQGLEMDSKDKSLRTPLHFAAIAGDPLVINRLVGFGIALDPKDVDGNSPLQLAVRAGYFSFVPQLLKRAGASSKASSLDYLIGAKNDVTSFFFVHPIITGFTTICTGFGIIAHYSMIAAKTVLVPLAPAARPPETPADGSLPTPDLALPAPHVILGGGLGGGGSDGGMLLPPLPAPVAPTHSQKSATSGQSLTPAKQFKAGAETLNIARRANNNAQIAAALVAAENLLRALKNPDPEAREERVHLLAAIGAVAKHAQANDQVRAEAERIRAPYIKKSKRH